MIKKVVSIGKSLETHFHDSTRLRIQLHPITNNERCLVLFSRNNINFPYRRVELKFNTNYIKLFLSLCWENLERRGRYYRR